MGQFAALCRLLGRPDLAAPPYLPGGLAGEAFLLNAATDELRRALSDAFAKARASDLETDLNAAGVPAARVRNLMEYLVELYPLTPGISIGGEPLAFGPAFRWEQAEGTNLPLAPKLGQDTDMLMPLVRDEATA